MFNSRKFLYSMHNLLQTITKEYKGKVVELVNQKRKLVYRRVGNEHSDISLVFLHGSTMTKEGMLPLAQQFENYNCLVFDLTAHGESEGEEPTEIWQFAEDVEYSLQQLQKENIITGRIILLGYSMGGAITCEIAIRKKVELSGIVLLSSGANLRDYTPLVDALRERPAEQFKAEEILGYLIGKDTPQTEAECIMKSFAETKVPDIIGYGDLIASNQYKHIEACREIAIPALMVHGCDDQIVLPMAAVETWKAIENSELLMIPYKGHGAIYEDTGVVRDKILSFIQNNNESR